MITLSQGSSVKVLISGGTQDGTEIDMTSTVGQLIPVLTAPSLLGLIRNTTAQISKDNNGSTIYRYAVKPSDASYIEWDATLKKHIISPTGTANPNGGDPRAALWAEAVEGIVRINPVLKGFKYNALEWDQSMNTIGSILSQYVASWVQVRRIRKQLEALELLETAVAAITITGTPTKFALGAHIEAAASATLSADEAYNAFKDGRNLFLVLGLPNAPVVENQNYTHAEGINMTDFLAILSPDFEAILKTKNGIFNSIPGFEAFSSYGFQGVLGVPTYMSQVMPVKTNFIMLTTGLQGTIGYEEVGKKVGGMMIVDPNAPGLAWRLMLWDQYSLGIIMPFQALIFKEAP